MGRRKKYQADTYFVGLPIGLESADGLEVVEGDYLRWAGDTADQKGYRYQLRWTPDEAAYLVYMITPSDRSMVVGKAGLVQFMCIVP